MPEKKKKPHKIKWTGDTFNVFGGCTNESEACRYCYARGMSNRLESFIPLYNDTVKKTPMGEIQWTGIINFMPSGFDKVKARKSPQLWFANSMSDVFHPSVSVETIDEFFSLLESTPQHTFQVLTKRAEKMKMYFSIRKNGVPKNVWLGVTCEDVKSGIDRINFLRNIHAPIKFLSVEPLLEDLGKLNLKGIDWVIVGGESGANARPMQVEWVRNIKTQCAEQGVKFFFKQWGSANQAELGRLFEGREWNDMPEWK